ncbi:uncharacterized protein LOC119444981 [Dermacentor silvarum]|uniref:uncharacterized protein LOC119444981 n=1 Tax=Dermacentor silvarum TaxID=543639 RepID=UPI0021012BB0|nr:uncharacterized protein LOC119444981 [Dermacentor silvarum]
MTDGALYQKQMEGCQWSDISLTFNTDGAKVFNCNKTALWPIQCVINELPVALRWSNVLLGGLWFGKGHPEMTKFLEVFVKEVLATGTMKWQCNEQKLESRIHVICCCVDAPARAAVLNSKQFNGYFGCSFCLHKGERHNGSMKYPVQGCQVSAVRTTSQVKLDIRVALSTGQPSHGVKGSTPLVHLPKFDLVWGVCPDYMHAVLEGVAKQLLEIWLSNVHSPAYIGEPSKCQRVTARLLHLRPPQFFTRLPRTLDDRSMWKASEWKWWLLFYAVPYLDGILEKKYHEHICLLVNGIFLLLKDEISKNDLKEAMDHHRIMPARHAKPNGGAECGTPASSSRPKRRAATAQVPTNNDSELAQDTMDMDDQAIETQVGSAADAEEEFLSPDEVVQGESTSDDDAEEISPREDDEAKNDGTRSRSSSRDRSNSRDSDQERVQTKKQQQQKSKKKHNKEAKNKDILLLLKEEVLTNVPKAGENIVMAVDIRGAFDNAFWLYRS